MAERALTENLTDLIAHRGSVADVGRPRTRAIARSLPPPPPRYPVLRDRHAAASQPPNYGAPAPASEPKGENTLWIFVGCGLLLLLTLCATSGGLVYYAMQNARGMSPSPTGGPAPSGQPPRAIQATVTQVMGGNPVAPNARCSFNVEHTGPHERRSRSMSYLDRLRRAAALRGR